MTTARFSINPHRWLAAFASPLLTIAANPESILASPAVDVIKSVPATWDETRVLAGSEIGELVLFARRSGDVWFLAAMNGPGTQTIQVPLSFLAAGRYQSTLVRDDAPDGSTVRVEPGVHTQKDTIALELRAGGGFLGRFRPFDSPAARSREPQARSWRVGVDSRHQRH